jgi:hypothetical protein
MFIDSNDYLTKDEIYKIYDIMCNKHDIDKISSELLLKLPKLIIYDETVLCSDILLNNIMCTELNFEKLRYDFFGILLVVSDKYNFLIKISSKNDISILRLINNNEISKTKILRLNKLKEII